MQKRALSVAIFLICAALISAQNLTVSVIPLITSSGVSKSDLQVITEYLEYGLIKTGRFHVIASEQRDAILGEQRFSLVGVTDWSCALEIGKLLSAQFMVFGAMTRQGNSYVVSVKLVNVETSKIVASSIDTMMNLSPAQIEKTTIKLAYELAGLTYTAGSE